jgi:hypothetical protein
MSSGYIIEFSGRKEKSKVVFDEVAGRGKTDDLL